jgi:uncharacterized protein related to proFAR isomerase
LFSPPAEEIMSERFVRCGSARVAERLFETRQSLLHLQVTTFGAMTHSGTDALHRLFGSSSQSVNIGGGLRDVADPTVLDSGAGLVVQLQVADGNV